MRIIGGEACSRQIDAPRGMDTRPTLDRVRETVFDVIQFHIAGAAVLDLFAGNGAYGLEALSRGASYVRFSDANRNAYNTLVSNIQLTRFEKQAQIWT